MNSKESARELLKSAFPGEKWAKKVDAMSDAQVFAVIVNLRQQNKLKG